MHFSHQHNKKTPASSTNPTTRKKSLMVADANSNAMGHKRYDHPTQRPSLSSNQSGTTVEEEVHFHLSI